MGKRNRIKKNKKLKDNVKKEIQETTLAERKDWVHRIKLELHTNNFGLPPFPEYEGMNWKDVTKKYKALRELELRLNIYELRGDGQHGFIVFPEAKRRIEYILDKRTTRNNHIKLKTLTKKHYGFVNK